MRMPCRAVKKLRYQAELLDSALPEVVHSLLKALASFQHLLGELHDVDVRIERLSEAALSTTPVPRALFAAVEAEAERRETLAA